MRVIANNIKLVGCRSVKGADGVTRTYGNMYTENGELLPFSSYAAVNDCMDGGDYELEISWGTGKNGKWVRCELLG